MNRRRCVVLISLPQRGDVSVMRTQIRSQSGFLKLVQTQHNFLRLDTRPAQYSYTHYFRHAPARLRVDVIGLFWYAATQLFALQGHSGPLKAQQGLGVKLGWLPSGGKTVLNAANNF